MTEQKYAIEPLTQPTPRTCVHTCLAMATGTDLNELIERFGDRPLGNKEETTVLIENRIFPVSTTGNAHEFPRQGTYLVSTPSLNLPGKLHMVIVLAQEGGYTVIDPNTGRDGVAAYAASALLDGDLARCEVTFLDRALLDELRWPAPE